MEKNKSNFSKFMLLWTGELISSIGGGLTSFGLGVYVFGKTGSAANMALVTLLGFLPTLLLSVPAGVLADRHDRRLLMMIGDGFSALGILYILICMIQGEAALWQICTGVFISSSFSALLEPSYRATVTDLLTKEEYSKASGMVSLAGSARYLISPVLAGALLTVSDIKLLLIIDICTFFPTVFAAAFIKKGIASKQTDKDVSFAESLKIGGKAVADKKGVLVLTLVSSLMTCFMGVFQILAQPLILDFADSATLGTAETVCACGMLVSGLVLGAVGIKKGYVKILTISLFISGIGMAGFGLWENIFVICIFGFIFFAMLPFANSCLDYLVRTNIPDELQGRAWGLIGFISQIGYVVAYAVSGAAADGLSAHTGISVGRGAAQVIIISGMLLCASAILLYSLKSVRTLEGTSYDMERNKAMDYLLKVENLCKDKILNNITFNVEWGEMTAVMGPSGSGKSTLLYNIAGMDKPTGGRVWLGSSEITSMTEDEKASVRLHKTGFVFQQMNMMKNLSIMDNILLPAIHANKGKSGKTKKELTERAELLMKKLSVSEIAERSIAEVSGGQLQRACICRSMINEPMILFADEPTGALNKSAAAEVMAEFEKLNNEGTTILMVTHDSKVAAACSRVLYLLDGRICGEIALGKPVKGTERQREEKLNGWLSEMGW